MNSLELFLDLIKWYLALTKLRKVTKIYFKASTYIWLTYCKIRLYLVLLSFLIRLGNLVTFAFSLFKVMVVKLIHR